MKRAISQTEHITNNIIVNNFMIKHHVMETQRTQLLNIVGIIREKKGDRVEEIDLEKHFNPTLSNYLDVGGNL